MSYRENFNEGVLSRLEALQASGARAAAEALVPGHPILAEMGIATTGREHVRALRDARPSALEAAGASPVLLEAIIRAVVRPPLLVRGGKVVMVPLPEELHALTADAVAAVEPVLTGVGRVEFVNHAMPWGGTGWAVADPEDAGALLVITNRHVAELVARRTARGEGVFLRSPQTMLRYGARIDFNEEVEATETMARPAEFLGFPYLADAAGADVAVARIRRPEAFAVEPLALADADGEDAELVAVVGYPAWDSRNDATEMDRYFRGLYDVKRFAPGFLIHRDEMLSHDCTTLGGNSGSPVVSLVTGRVVGLHFAGRYGIANQAIRAGTLRALLRGERPVQVLVASLAPQERADGRHPPEHFTGRDGYRADFLEEAPGDGLTVPLPRLPEGAFDLAAPSDATADRPHELRYTHFSVLYDTRRMSPVVAAVNIDGARSVAIKRGDDQWFIDERIPPAVQRGSADFPGDLDRGHMVRREDPNWGTEAEAKAANDDTFHYVNAAAQHADLNQSKAQWLGLEDYVLGSARTWGFRASVFSGPILREDDPPLDPARPEGQLLPLEFWKVVVMRAEAGEDAGALRLHATAYVLSQGAFIADYLARRRAPEALEGFAFGAWRTFQVRVADLEAVTGYDFGPLRDADPLARRTAALELPDAAVALEVTGPESLVL